MAQIVAFNWPQYVAGISAVALLVAVVLSIRLSPALLAILLTAMALALWWTCASLTASFWLYDRSGLHGLRWLPESVRGASRWVNIHAGLDEFSRPLESALAHPPAAVVDIYDARVITERSIARARRHRAAHPLECSASHGDLPISSAGCDAVFVLFAAHELRRHQDRVGFFREVRRTLAPGGRVVVIEHMRDAPNALAFGPGFFHFLGRSSWLRVFEEAALRVETERRHTPFARVFVLRNTP